MSKEKYHYMEMAWLPFQKITLSSYQIIVCLVCCIAVNMLKKVMCLSHRIVIRIKGAITCGLKLKAKLATSLKATLL